MHSVNSLLESFLEAKFHDGAWNTYSWATRFNILIGFLVKLRIDFLWVPSPKSKLIILVLDLLGYEGVGLTFDHLPSNSQVADFGRSLKCLKILLSSIVFENWRCETLFFKYTSCGPDQVIDFLLDIQLLEVIHARNLGSRNFEACQGSSFTGECFIFARPFLRIGSTVLVVFGFTLERILVNLHG